MTMSTQTNAVTGVGAARPVGAWLITLLKGVIYREGDERAVGRACCDLQARVRDYVGVLGLELVLDEAEGYAFLRPRRSRDGRGRAQAAAAGRAPAAVVPGQPAAGAAAQEAGRVRRRRRRHAAGPVARRDRRTDARLPARRQQRGAADRPDRDAHQQGRRSRLPAPPQAARRGQDHDASRCGAS